ncbi:MAG: AraC family transcriptional regulator [Sphingomonas oligoaromativorans]
MSAVDWLSRLLEMITVKGKLEVRCAYGAPWRVAWDRSAVHEIPYHVVLRGRVVIEDPGSGAVRKLVGGDIVLLPSGAPHVLHDGSGTAPAPTQEHLTSAGWVVSENGSEGEPLDMLCGRFLIGPPHDRLMRSYLPTNLVVHAAEAGPETGVSPMASAQLASLIDMMRMESAGDKAGGYAILNALSSALFALVLRAASETDQAPEGLLALAGHARLGPAISAMFADPARAWSLSELAESCGMSRATFSRHFQDRLGRSAFDLLADIRMSIAANELKKPGKGTEAVADLVGYQSVAAFRRMFADKMGMTAGQWRRQARASQ